MASLLEQMNQAGIPDIQSNAESNIQSEKKSMILEMEAKGYVSPKVGVKTALGIKKPTFISRVKEDIQKRGMEWGDILERVTPLGEEGNKNQITALEAGISAVGKALQLFTQDIPMDVARSVLPTWLKEGIKTSFATSPAVKLLNAPINKEGGTVPQLVEEKYNQWKEKNPRAAIDLESFFNIATALPVIKGYEAIGEKTIEQVRQLPEAVKRMVKGNEIKNFDKILTNAENAITLKPKEISKNEYEELVGKGKISPKTATKPASYILTEEEKSLAQKYNNLLQNNDPVKNSQNVLNEIISKDAQVGEFLKKNNGIFNDSQLKSYLMKKLEPITDISIPSEERLIKAKQDLVDTFVSSVKSNKQEELWNARKVFDAKVNEKINAFSGTPTLKKDLVVNLRNGVQDFIAKNTPEGIYKGLMKDMRGLFKIQEILEIKANSEKGMSGLKVWIKNNPGKVKLVEWLGGGVIGYSILKKMGVPLP